MHSYRRAALLAAIAGSFTLAGCPSGNSNEDACNEGEDTCNSSEGACNEGDGCPRGQLCVAGACLKICTSPEGCAVGQTCTEDACREGDDCPDGHACVAGACVGLCARPEDCRVGHTCAEGVCRELTRGKCGKAEDCTSPGICEIAPEPDCVAGLCTYGAAVDGSACTSATGAAGVCLDKTCVGCIEP